MLKHRIGKLIIPLLPISLRSFSILRFELNAFVTRTLNRFWPPYRKIISDINQRKEVSLNLGSGGRGLGDWVNIDVMRHHADQTIAYDIRYGLPFRDNLADRILAEHVLEHLDFKDAAPKILADCLRVLKPGCYMRVIIPDGKRWLEAYVHDDPQLWTNLGMANLPADMPTRMSMINHVFHQNGEHHFAYDFETLKHLLDQAGFESVVQSSFRTSADPRLKLDREEHKLYSLYVEARKPR